MRCPGDIEVTIEIHSNVFQHGPALLFLSVHLRSISFSLVHLFFVKPYTKKSQGVRPRERFSLSPTCQYNQTQRSFRKMFIQTIPHIKVPWISKNMGFECRVAVEWVKIQTSSGMVIFSLNKKRVNNKYCVDHASKPNI